MESIASRLEVFRPDGSPRPVEEAPPLRALRGEMVKDQEELVRTPIKGELRYRQVSASPVRDANGSIIGSVSVVRDITDRKRTEMELESIKARLEAIIDQMPVGILVADARSGEILFATDEIEKMYGLGFRPTDIKGFVDHTRLARLDLDGRSYKTDEYPFFRSLKGEV